MPDQPPAERDRSRREPLEELIESVLGDVRFSQLDPPVVVNTVDVNSGMQVFWGLAGLDDVLVGDAVFASCALPGYLPPRDIRGRYYVDGIIVENDDYTLYSKQNDLPQPDTLSGGNMLIYLDVWERYISAIEDDSIREVALGGPDTAGRVKVVWQVRARALSQDESADDYTATWNAITRPVEPGARGRLRARTPNQSVYLDNIANHDITFGIGPAGTGKTYLAVASAVDALERSAVQRIVLTRPAVEAGERLGFLPGDLTQKVDPYLRPLYDALYDLMGFDRVTKAFERNTLEIAPLAFMRGRTLNNAFVILDEAQNTTPEQMKMFLTRLGFGSKMVVTGDITQVDLPGGASGLRLVTRILDGVDDIHFSRLTSDDVVRHSLVARIVDAYTEYDQRQQAARFERDQAREFANRAERRNAERRNPPGPRDHLPRKRS